MSEQVFSIGRIVLYRGADGSEIGFDNNEVSPAIVTGFGPKGGVHLAVLLAGHTQMAPRLSIRQSDDGQHEPGTWIWPPRV